MKPITLLFRVVDFCILFLFFTADHRGKACKCEYCYIFHITLVTLRKGKGGIYSSGKSTHLEVTTVVS